MKILHTADYQLNANKYDECIEMMKAIQKIARDESPDLIVIAGDLFDNRQYFYKRSMVLPAFSFVKSMSRIAPVVIVKGNEMHDATGSIEALNIIRPMTCPIYATERIESVVLCKNMLLPVRDLLKKGGDVTEFKEADALIHFLPYPDKGQLLAQAEAMSIDEANRTTERILENILEGFGVLSDMTPAPSILVGHVNTFGAVLSNGTESITNEVSIHPTMFSRAKVDYAALGHNHRMQMVAPKVYFSGSTRHVTSGEKEKKYVLSVDVKKGVDPVVNSVLLPSIPLVEYEFEINDDGEYLLLKPEAEDMIDDEWNGAHLKVKVRLKSEQAVKYTQDRLMEDVKRDCPGAYSYKVDRIVIPQTSIRHGQITTVRLLRDKMTVYAGSVDRDVSESLLEKCDTLEAEFGRVDR